MSAYDEMNDSLGWDELLEESLKKVIKPTPQGFYGDMPGPTEILPPYVRIAKLSEVVSRVEHALLTCRTDGETWTLTKPEVEAIRKLIKAL